MIKKYLLNILISIDQGFNVLFGGDPDETISSRLGKSMRRGNQGWFTEFLVKFLDKIDPNHCKKSIEDDEGNDTTFQG